MARPKDENKLAAIYTATLKLVNTSGMAGLTIAQVAAEAGIATGTVYVYFRDKNELINNLFGYLENKLNRSLFEGYIETDSFISNFRQLWNAFLHVQIERPEETAFLEQYLRSPFTTKHQLQTEPEQFLRPLWDLLETGKRQMLVKEADTALLLAQITGPVYEASRMMQAQRLNWDEEQREQLLKMAWDAIKS